MTPEKILYTARAEATGGREGHIKSDDGALDLALTTPKELGGAGKFGVNPEQMFAAGYAACFIGALKVVAGQEKITLPADTKIASEVGIGPITGGFGITASLSISLPGIEKAKAEDLIAKAHQVCPYSNATRGNVDVKLSLAS
ncbi:organic hydroperoxide resistance protein [Kiloniella laminariae]|uniref:organic hydroperoxide resistance protein n=1 Tax=Kiloniella laminariae TaxID=454162 RepID=UPI00035CFCE1|nr:organic hydroperoxide resistance protein [Kiloniella laminariae]